MNTATIKVIDKEINVDGKAMFVKLLELEDGTQGWVGSQVRDYFELGSNQAVTDLSRRAEIRLTKKILTGELRGLKVAGVVHMRTPHAMFYTKDDILEMALYSNSESAKNMVRYTFGVAEAVHKGEILPEQREAVDAAVQSALANAPGANTPLLPLVEGRLVFTSDYLRKLATFMQEQEELIEAEQARAKAAEEELGKQYNVVKLLSKRIESRDAEILDRQWYPLEYVKKEAPPAATISRECPHIWAEAMAYKRKYGQHRKGFEEMNDNGWVTQYLKVVHNVKSNIQEMIPPPLTKDAKTNRYAAGDSGKLVPRFLYNRADVTRVENLLALLAKDNT